MAVKPVHYYFTVQMIEFNPKHSSPVSSYIISGTLKSALIRKQCFTSSNVNNRARMTPALRTMTRTCLLVSWISFWQGQKQPPHLCNGTCCSWRATQISKVREFQPLICQVENHFVLLTVFLFIFHTG